MGFAGKKQCQNCKQYVGVRTAKCDCGHEFPRKSVESIPAATPATPATPAPPQEAVESKGLAVIWAVGAGMTGSGSVCPCKPKELTEQAIGEWVDELQNTHCHVGYRYAPSAIKRMASTIWPRYLHEKLGTNPDFVKACQFIDIHSKE